MHYKIGISKKLILSTFKISQLKFIISDLYTGHLLLSQPQPLLMVKNGTTSSHSNTATLRIITHCSQTHLKETLIKHKCIFIKKASQSQKYKNERQFNVTPNKWNTRSFLEEIKTLHQWNYAEDLLLAGYIILFWNKFRN
jgi:hypothetical protein